MSARQAGPATASTRETSSAPRRLRADAARNRERLLAAGREAFEQQGADASLEEIAKRAGVGIGTLYRHFPTREALLEAVFQERLDGLTALGDELLGAPDAFEALTRWLHAHLVNASACQGFAGTVVIDLLDLDERDEDHEPACTRMRETGAQLLARAQAEGSARADADAEDLVRLVNALVSATADADDRGALADRLFTLMVDGLRAPAGR